MSDYLWDPGAAADPDVQAVERALAGVRFEPSRQPLAALAPAPRIRALRPLAVLAMAASLLVMTGAGLWSWRLDWPEGRAWTMETATATVSIDVGREISLPSGAGSDAGAVANIARIGSMRIGPRTSFELRATRGTRHRLRMDDGSVHVRVWAPPRSVVIETPAGEVIDMGCEFQLTVEGETSRVRVLSGWVQLDNRIDEMMVPAGASSEMTPTHGPGVPVFDDAARGFREAVRALESGAGGLDGLLRLARPRDVYTLLLLADRMPGAADSLLRRAAELSPPPGDITTGRILRGDRQALWAWSDSLPLPPPKKWWRHWRDALPFWMSER
jgi:hypothetical protein